MNTSGWKPWRVVLLCVAALVAAFWVFRLVQRTDQTTAAWLGIVAMVLVIISQVLDVRSRKAKAAQE